MKHQRIKGALLIESMIAITIAVVGILGIFSLLSRSVSLNRIVSDRYIANYLAAEGIEIVKNLIDVNVSQGKPWNLGLEEGVYEVDYDYDDQSPLSHLINPPRPILFDPVAKFYNYDVGQPTNFKRAVGIKWFGDGNEMQVNSVVGWISRGGAVFEIDLEDHFFNWK